MKREILKVLLAWKEADDHKPLLLRGARQVGKTYVVNELGKSFKSFVSINLELDFKMRTCFDNLAPKEIIDNLSILTQQTITPGETLLFIDEIQAYPKAIEALRYFRELMPTLHVIAAGSLLEFVLHQDSISMPVGRIEYLYMQPCSFTEFLLATGHEKIIEKLNTCSLNNSLSPIIHRELLQLFKTYMAVGGMPEALATYQKTKQIFDAQRVQRSILQTYRDDFGKYASQANLRYLQTVFDKTPGMVGSVIKYKKIDADFRSRDLKQAIEMLEYAGVIKRIIATSASGLPLITTTNEKKFKLQFLDIGLTQCACDIGPDILQTDLSKLNDGGLAEQVVGQSILAYIDPFLTPHLFFWARDARNSSAEIDFVISTSGKIIPIEVKSGAHGRLKSLHLFLQEKNLDLGIKISTAPLSYEKNILNIPFYLMSELTRLAKTAL